MTTLTHDADVLAGVGSSAALSCVEFIGLEDALRLLSHPSTRSMRKYLAGDHRPEELHKTLKFAVCPARNVA